MLTSKNAVLFQKKSLVENRKLSEKQSLFGVSRQVATGRHK
jgi:hypothetical protein